MRGGRPSITASLVAAARAAAGVDPFATRLVPHPFALLARVGRGRWSPMAPLVALMRVRTLAIDAPVQEAARRGVSQLVILGAGLCARAWRLDELRDSTVYEVDHPATQRHKRSRLEGLVPKARDVRFVPVDFERDDLQRALDQSGHDTGAPTTWIWEGVTPYLTREAIASTLAAVRARSAEGSTIALTYYPPSRRHTEPLLRTTAFAVRLLGEPFRALLDTGAMHDLLARSGFELKDDASYVELAERLGLPATWSAIDERVLVAAAARA